MAREGPSQKDIAVRLRDCLREKLTGLGVEVEAPFNLYYSLSIDSAGRVTTEKADKGIIRRGGLSSFETDLAIFERPHPGEHVVPRVVVEILRGVSTHHLIIYSTKAARHKEVYPYLQYGLLVVGEKAKIHPKVLRHGQHFDFMYVTPAAWLNEEELETLASVVSQQIEQSRQIGRYLGRLAREERPTLAWKRLDFE